MSIFRPELLAGRVAYLTGGTSGIGLGIAEEFARHGAKVAVQGRKAEKAEAAAVRLRDLGAQAISIAADVRDYDATAAGIEKTAQLWGAIDILVCGAAGNFPVPAAELTPNGFKAVTDIDLLGTFHTCRAAYAHLRKPGASIIAISATHGAHPYAHQAHVCAAKAGVDMLVRVLAMEWGRDGIRVNGIAPGPVDDTEGMRRLAPTEEMRNSIANAVPLRRFAAIEEIAACSLFLVSDAASYVTGTILTVDGGVSLTGFGSRLG